MNVVEALGGAGKDPRAWPTADSSFYESMRASVTGDRWSVYKDRVRAAYALGVSGLDARAWPDGDLIQLTREGYHGGQFGDPAGINDDTFAILALWAAGVPAHDPQIQAARQVLLDNRHPDGGWAWTRVAPSADPDMTGMALAALHVAGEDVTKDERARLFLQRSKDPLTGGYLSAVEGVNCQSTVWALHARHLLGMGADREAEAFLLSLQTEEGGFRKKPTSTTADAFCTTEAALYLSGGRYPLKPFAPLRLVQPPHARVPVDLHPGSMFTTFAWRFTDPGVVQREDGFVFPRAGAYAYELDARGPKAWHRGSGVLEVLSARPVLALAGAALQGLRGEPVALDASASRDPDGHIARLSISWGDGNTSDAASLTPRHTYTLPGTYVVTVKAFDDAGIGSEPRSVTVTIRNREPAFPPLPPRLVADRTAPLNLSWTPTDPEGDPLALNWTWGNLSGNGTTVHLRALGTDILRLSAQDPFGAQVHASVEVEVVNILPTLEQVSLPATAKAGESFSFSAQARDADGPTPKVAWIIGGTRYEGEAGEATLAAGVHEVVLIATDADGGTRRSTATLRVLEQEGGAPSEALAQPLRIRDLTLRLENGTLFATWRADATEANVTLAWWSDAGEGETKVDGTEHTMPLEGTWARVRLTLEQGEHHVSAEAGPVHAQRGALPPPVVRTPSGQPVVGTHATFHVDLPQGATEARFDWGDGNQTTWSAAVGARHAWEKPGIYSVTAHARSPDGRASHATLLVHVVAPPQTPLVAAAPAEEEKRMAASDEDAPLAEASWSDMPPDAAPRHEVPAAWLWGLVAAVAVGLARVRRQA